MIDGFKHTTKLLTHSCDIFRCKRLGTQCWVYICIGCSELVLNLKFGREELFSRTGPNDSYTQTPAGCVILGLWNKLMQPKEDFFAV